MFRQNLEIEPQCSVQSFVSNNIKRNQIIKIGMITMCINMSNLIVFSYFGVYLKFDLGLSFAALGFLEGVIDGLNYFLKFFSGVLCDCGAPTQKVRHVKKLFLFGITIITLCKPLEAIFRTFWPIFFTKLAERTGNALQSTPRDYLLSENMGKTGGVQETTFLFKAGCGGLGCLLGSIFSGGLFFYLKDYQKVFWFSVIPGAIAVYLCVKLLKQETTQKRENNWAVIKARLKNFGITLKNERHLISKKYYQLLIVSFLYNMGRVSDTMAIIYAFSKSHTPTWCTPFFFAVFHLGVLTSAFSLGQLLLKYPKPSSFLKVGLLIFVIALQCFIFCEYSVLLGYIAMFLLGVYGACNSLFPNQIVQIVPTSLRGTAHGLYNLTSSVALLLGGTLGGLFADKFTQQAAFIVSSLIAIIVLVFLAKFVKEEKE